MMHCILWLSSPLSLSKGVLLRCRHTLAVPEAWGQSPDMPKQPPNPQVYQPPAACCLRRPSNLTLQHTHPPCHPLCTHTTPSVSRHRARQASTTQHPKLDQPNIAYAVCDCANKYLQCCTCESHATCVSTRPWSANTDTVGPCKLGLAASVQLLRGAGEEEALG